MSEVSCTSCQDLRSSAPTFATNGVTNSVCKSLKENKGLARSNGHDNATDLHLANDCLIGRMRDEIDAYDVCDWKEFMRDYISNEYEVNKAIICALGGIWSAFENLVDALGGGDGVIPVMRRYRVTVPKSAFGKVWRVTSGTEQNEHPETTVADNWYSVTNITEWFAGSGDNEDVGEFWIKVPTSEMDSILGVWTQTWVVPGGNSYDGKGKPYIQTVNVQEWYKSGNYLNINFDTYELCPPGGGTASNNGGPYPVTVDFLVVGTRTLL